MKTSNVALYALRLAFGQQGHQVSSAGNTFGATSPDRIVTRSATMLAVFGIALSSFSLKQLLASSHNKSTNPAVANTHNF